MKLLFLMFIVSCANVKVLETKPETKVKPTFLIEGQNVILQPGKIKFLEVETTLENGKYNLDCTQRKIPFLVSDNKASFYLIESYFSKLKKETCQYLGKTILILEKKDFPYKSEKLNVDKKRVFLSKKDLDIVIKERVIKKKMYEKSSPYFLFDRPFVRPLNSYVTSHYGNKRLFNNKKQSQHLGNDLRAAVGVKIPVTNNGKVVFAGHLFYTGNAVVVDHGLEIFSIYGHLSKILVSKGDFLKQGDIVGLAGATGRVSGPHLHWGVKVQGQWIDGFSLVDESKKHFE